MGPNIAFAGKEARSGHYQLWIKPLQGCLENDTLVLRAPNEFVRAWIQDRMLDKIRDAAAETLGYVRPSGGAPGGLPDRQGDPGPAPQEDRHPPDGPAHGPRPAHADGAQLAAQLRRLHRRACNNLAYVASRSFCQDEQGSDQLFLCSAPGLGKTHLAQAIGSEIARQTNRQHLRVCYLSGEEFASQLVMAIKAKAVEQFKARFRSGVDLLLLEDVHFSRVRKRCRTSC